MLCDADIVGSWRARPRGFVALMGLYESNYLWFRRLAGEPKRLRGLCRSVVDGDCELRLAVIEHLQYTSVLTLTYALPALAFQGAELVPHLPLRAYHDARLLEAEPGGNITRPGTGTGGTAAARSERELRQRWARNMMLNKWLEYCVERGHRFA